MIFRAAIFFSVIKAVPDPIPELKPPRGEIVQTLWEAHGTAFVIGAILVLSLLVAVFLEWRKAKPVPIARPVDTARRELDRLRSPRDPLEALLAVSSTLRRYLVSRFNLPGPGLTADEITVSIPTDPALATQLHRFLSDCDLVKFAPDRKPPAPEPIIHDALRLLEAVERRSPPAFPPA